MSVFGLIPPQGTQSASSTGTQATQGSLFGNCDAGQGGGSGPGGSPNLSGLGGSSGSGGNGGSCAQTVTGGINTGLSGLYAGNLNNSSLDAINTSGGGVNLYQESPEALATAGQAITGALQYASQTTGAAQQQSAGLFSAAEELAKSSTATSSQQFDQLIIDLAIVAGVLMAGYLLLKKV